MREALVRDIWVIATDAGGVVEDIVEGENGNIIPLEATGSDLARAIDSLLERSDALKRHINPYKDKIRNYNQQAMELRGLLELAINER